MQVTQVVGRNLIYPLRANETLSASYTNPRFVQNASTVPSVRYQESVNETKSILSELESFCFRFLVSEGEALNGLNQLVSIKSNVIRGKFNEMIALYYSNKRGVDQLNLLTNVLIKLVASVELWEPTNPLNNLQMQCLPTVIRLINDHKIIRQYLMTNNDIRNQVGHIMTGCGLQMIQRILQKNQEVSNIKTVFIRNFSGELQRVLNHEYKQQNSTLNQYSPILSQKFEQLNKRLHANKNSQKSLKQTQAIDSRSPTLQNRGSFTSVPHEYKFQILKRQTQSFSRNQQNLRLATELNDKRREIQELNNKLANALKESNFQKVQTKEIEQRYSNISREKVQQLADQNYKLQSRITAMVISQTRIKKQNEQLFNSLKIKQSELQQIRFEFNVQIQALERERRQLISKNQVMMDKFKKADQQRGYYRIQLQQESIRNFQNQSTQKEGFIEEIQNEIQNLKKQIQLKQNSCSVLLGEKSDLQVKISNLERQLYLLKDQNKTLQNTMKQREAEFQINRGLFSNQNQRLIQILQQRQGNLQHAVHQLQKLNQLNIGNIQMFYRRQQELISLNNSKDEELFRVKQQITALMRNKPRQQSVINEQIKSLSFQLQKCKTELNNSLIKNQNLNSIQRQYETLKKELASLRNEKDSLERRLIDAKNNTANDLKGDLVARENTLLKQKNNQLQFTLANLSNDIQKKKLQNINIQNQVNKLRNQVEQQFERLSRISEQNQRMRTAIQVKDEQMLRLVGEKAQLQAQTNQNMKMLLGELQKSIRQKQKYLAQYENLKFMQKQYEALKREKTTVSYSQNHLKDTLAECQLAMSRLTADIKKKEYDSQILRNQAERKGNEHLKSIVAKYQAQNRNLENIIQSLTNDLSGKQEMLKQIHMKSETINRQKSIIDRKYAQLKADKQSSQNQIQQRNQEIAYLNDQIEKLSNMNNDIVKQNQQLNNNNEQLIQQNKKLVKSNSAKVIKLQEKVPISPLRNGEQMADLRVKLREANRQISDLSNELQQKQNMIGQLEESLQSVKNDNTILQINNAQLKTELNNLSLKFKQQIKHIQQEKQRSSQQVSKGRISEDNQTQIQKYKQQILGLKRQNLGFRQSLGNWQAPNGNPKQKIESLFANNLFQGAVIQGLLPFKKYLKQVIQNRFSYKIIRTRLVYAYDTINKINFHKYVDGVDNLLLIVKMANGTYTAGFSEGRFESKLASAKDGLIISLTHEKCFTLVQPNRRAITYDDFYIIFGNSELRLKSLENKLFSNFGISNGYYNARGQKVSVLLGGLPSERELELEHYEFYEVFFDYNW